MDLKLYTFCWVALTTVGIASTHSIGDSCVRNDDRVVLSDNCKDYLECKNGTYVRKSCGFWQIYDIIYEECRWSPLASCQKSGAKKPVVTQTLLTVTSDKLYCNYTSQNCHHGVPVIGTCDWFCYCFPNYTYSGPLQCRRGTYYDVKMFTCTDDPSACKEIPSNPTLGGICLNSRDMAGYTGNCKKYYECSLDNTWIVQECSWGQYFNSNSMECETNWLFMHCSQ